jgi:hypothetical protein
VAQDLGIDSLRIACVDALPKLLHPHAAAELYATASTIRHAAPLAELARAWVEDHTAALARAGPAAVRALPVHVIRQLLLGRRPPGQTSQTKGGGSIEHRDRAMQLALSWAAGAMRRPSAISAVFAAVDWPTGQSPLVWCADEPDEPMPVASWGTVRGCVSALPATGSHARVAA